MTNYNELQKAVFKINTALGSGSGCIISTYPCLVTNYHVIEGCRQVALEDYQQNRMRAEVRYVNPELDLAFLLPAELPANVGIPLPELNYEVDVRDRVSVLGYPFGMPFTVTEGIVSNKRQLVEGQYFIQTDAAVNPGNSGGPLINEKGCFVGIATSKFLNADNVGFAIPASIVIDELNHFKNSAAQSFVVKCNSCKYLVDVPTDYCPNCGADIDPEIFEETPLDRFAVFVESAIQLLGSDPLLARGGLDYWEFHHGTSLIRIFIYEEEFLYATSPLNYLPEKNLEALYRYLLSNPVPPYQLSIYQHQIFISYRVRLSDLFSSRAEEVRQLLAYLPQKADEMDDFFASHYNCPKTHYAREQK
jgi:hypothetical protein